MGLVSRNGSKIASYFLFRQRGRQCPQVRLEQEWSCERWSYHEEVPLRFRKAGRVWCGDARETHGARCHNGVTPSKTKEFLKSPCLFLNLNGI